MARSRKYGKYPHLERLLRAMSPEGRELVAHWHRVLTTALEGYLPHAMRGAKETYGGKDIGLCQPAAALGAQVGLQSWLNTMRDVAAIIVDPSAADWCCKPGMLASPEPCPQHGFDVRVLYDNGTIIERVEPGTQDTRERCVHIDSSRGGKWVSVTYGHVYDQEDMETSQWTVVGHV